MDRIIESYLSKFRKDFEYDKKIDNTKAFEDFVNYTILERKIEEKIDADLIDDLNIGKNSTIGLDGFAILINGHLVQDIENIDLILNDNKKSKAEAEVYFIQSKTTKSFEGKEILSFGQAVADFVSQEPKYIWTDLAREKINLFNHLISRATDLAYNPVCHLFYVTLGQLLLDKNLEASRENVIKYVRQENVFSEIDFNFIDSNGIQSDYKKINQTNEKTFLFEVKAPIPDIDNVEESYIGILPATTIIDLITDEDKQLMHTVFYDNVRDFQDLNKVNSEIQDTLQDENLKYAFSVLNNGLTIIAETLHPSRKNITITNYQIINGLQTSRVLFKNKELLDDKIFVPVKLIITKDQRLISKIIRSTNRQTAIKEEDLLAYSDFHKNLEDFYQTYPPEERLYYERRSKQFKSSKIDNKLIIDKSTQIKALGSMYYYKPNLATRFFGALFKEFGHQLFKSDDKMLPYYTAAYSLYKLEELFRNNALDKRYKKIKYFVLMAIKLEIDPKKIPPFNSGKVEAYCQNILDIVNNSEKFKELAIKVTEKIEELGYDLDYNEVSKSSRLASDLKDQYILKTFKPIKRA